MAFEGIKEQIDQKHSEAAPESSNSGSEASSQNVGGAAPDSSVSAPDSSSDVTDISKLEKFMFEGKEYTGDEFKKKFIPHSLYTKKNQEYARERQEYEAKVQELNKLEEFDKNFDADLETVLREPNRINEFKQLYPVRYHSYVDRMLREAQSRGTQTQTQGDQPRMDRATEDRLSKLENFYQNQERQVKEAQFTQSVETSRALLDSTCEKLAQKYPDSDEDAVLARASEYLSTMKPEVANSEKFAETFTKAVEQLYKQSHEFHAKRYQAKYKEMQNQQKQANHRGRDMGQGGATPDRSASKMKLSDVKNHILASQNQR